MDFLKAFEQAQTLGLTKDEFINVWESESKLKMVVRAGEMNSPVTGHEDMKQVFQTDGQNSIEGHGSSVDGAVNKSETVPTTKQGSHSVPDFLYRQLIEKYEQLCQQMHLKYDLLLHEFHSHFEVLSNHINNVEEAQANSLKLYFMQEIDLLKQDIKGFIEEQNRRPETALKQPVMSEQKIPGGKLQNLSIHPDVTSQPQSSPSYQISSHSKDQGNNNKAKNNNFQQKTEGFQVQGDLAQPGREFQLSGNRVVMSNTGTPQQAPKRSENSFADILRTAPVKSKMNAGGMPASVKKAATNLAPAVGLKNPGSTEAVLNVNKGSVAATGLLAHAIASQMKLKQASQEGSVKSGPNSVKSEPIKAKSRKKKAKSHISKTASAVKSKYEFTVDAVSNIIGSDKLFLSPYVYSSGKPCKVRVALNMVFMSFRLTVQIHVAKGDFDDSHKWPLTLKGSGYVFHPGSQQYSPLWQLEPVICEKPSGDREQVFPTVVCLKTSRCSMNDVTIQELMMRYKVGEDSLMFLWDLQATEKQKSVEELLT